MKKVLFGLLFTLVTMVSFSQEKPFIKDGFYNTTLENGVGVEQKVKFTISEETYNQISNCETFKKWKEVTFSNPKNEGYIEKHKDWDNVILYLNSLITMSSFELKHIKLKILNFIKES